MFGCHPCVKATKACVRCVAISRVKRRKKKCMCASVAVWQCAGVGSVVSFVLGKMKLGVMASNQICGLVATACSESRIRGDNSAGTWARGNEVVNACPFWLDVHVTLDRTKKEKKNLHPVGSGNASNRMSAKCPYRWTWDRLLVSMFASGWRVSC